MYKRQGDERQAKEIFEDLRFYDKNTMFYPAKDLLFFQADIQGNLLIRQRMCVVKALLEQKELTVDVYKRQPQLIILSIFSISVDLG